MAHIEIKNLSFKYKTSEKNSLSDVSFTINKGDFVVENQVVEKQHCLNV